MKFVSLFAGVGGFDLGLEQAGMTCVGQVEIDKHAQSVLQKHWPDVPKHDDVQTAKDWADQIGLTGNVDLVAGGFPCQDLSIGGKRAGLAGARSGLFYDALDFATHVKAKWVMLENVAGLFSSNNGHDFVAVISALRNSGYSYVEWRLFDSQFHGVPQRRRRIYIVGHIADPNRFPIFVERESGSRDSTESKQSGQDSAAEIAGSSGEGSVFGQSSFAGYSERVTTLTATTYKRPEDNIAVQPYTASSFAKYQEGVGTVRASGGDLGGGSETLLVASRPETSKE
jgi:DNA (cytosine-5)-methyltransferase 1